MVSYRNKIGFILCLSCIVLFSCSKEVNLIPDNEPFGSFNISDIKIENYVNRLYIDLIGREPIDEELEAEVDILKASDLNLETREAIIFKLMNDTTFRENEFSYKAAYAQNLYNLAKDRCLEGVPDNIIIGEIGIIRFAAFQDSLNGNWDSYYENLESIRKLELLVDSRQALYDGLIEYHQMYAFMIDNSFYDVINMNTFNFIRASFDQLLWRFPTQQEFDKIFNMIEFNQSEEIFGNLGASKNDFINILIDSPGMEEGMIIWAFRSLINRDPTPEEMVSVLQEYNQTKSIDTVINLILVTDEYANFR